LKVYANSLPQKIGNKQNQSVHTRAAFLKICRVVHEQKDKKCLRNTNMWNYLPSFDNSSICG